MAARMEGLGSSTWSRLLALKPVVSFFIDFGRNIIGNPYRGISSGLLVNRAQPPWHSAVTHESPLGNQELRLKKLWQVVIHPVCRLFVSKGDLKHGKVGVMLADNLHSHRQLVFVEPDGDTDNRQTR